MGERRFLARSFFYLDWVCVWPRTGWLMRDLVRIYQPHPSHRNQPYTNTISIKCVMNCWTWFQWQQPLQQHHHATRCQEEIIIFSLPRHAQARVYVWVGVFVRVEILMVGLASGGGLWGGWGIGVEWPPHWAGRKWLLLYHQPVWQKKCSCMWEDCSSCLWMKSLLSSWWDQQTKGSFTIL